MLGVTEGRGSEIKRNGGFGGINEREKCKKSGVEMEGFGGKKGRK